MKEPSIEISIDGSFIFQRSKSSESNFKSKQFLRRLTSTFWSFSTQKLVFEKTFKLAIYNNDV